MNIVVAGTGYVGLVTGACLAEKGHNVVCVDVDKEKVALMKRGISPIYEPGLEELLRRNYDSRRLYFTVDYKSAYKNADVIFIGVGTPERADGSANLDYVFKVCDQIAENVEKNCVVVVKSTVPVGTNDRVERFLREHVKEGIEIDVASNPEFLSQGTAVHDTLEAKRIVIGASTVRPKEVLKKIYEPFNIPIVITDRRSAEMIKYASNDFLALKISFINEIANICEIVGANIDDVVTGMGYDDRIGNKFLKAGLGYGGSCFPKDTKALHWLSNDNGYEIKTIKATIEVNENQKYKLFRKAKERFGVLEGKKVAILGLTFKPGTDDLREAPSIGNVRRLLDEGADIYAYDPVGMENFKKIFGEDKITYVDEPRLAIEDATAAFIFTEWNEIKNIDITEYKALMKIPVLFDGRNCYDLDEARKCNMEYYSIGRPKIGGN